MFGMMRYVNTNETDKEKAKPNITNLRFLDIVIILNMGNSF